MQVVLAAYSGMKSNRVHIIVQAAETRGIPYTTFLLRVSYYKQSTKLFIEFGEGDGEGGSMTPNHLAISSEVLNTVLFSQLFWGGVCVCKYVVVFVAE